MYGQKRRLRDSLQFLCGAFCFVRRPGEQAMGALLHGTWDSVHEGECQDPRSDDRACEERSRRKTMKRLAKKKTKRATTTASRNIYTGHMTQMQLIFVSGARR